MSLKKYNHFIYFVFIKKFSKLDTKIVVFLMPSPLFAVPLNMGTSTWVVTIVAGISFVVMFGISSAAGDFQGLINSTLESDALSREKRKDKNK